ncbi:MAG: hypothetical protein LASZOEIN_001901 [Candidatus Fervidibacter sp.]
MAEAVAAVGQVVAVDPVVQAVEAVEVVRVVEVDLQVAEAAVVVRVVVVLQAVQVEPEVVQEVDPLAVKTVKVAAKKQRTPLKASKRTRKSEQSLQKATESDGAYQFTCQAG